MNSSQFSGMREADMSAATDRAPENAAVFDVALKFVHAHALQAVVGLGVPDLLVDGPLTAEEIAAVVGRRAGPLRRVLRMLAGAGYFMLEEDRVGLTDQGQALVSGHPSGSRDFLLMVVGPTMTGAFSHLDATLRSGRSGIEEAFGVGLFEYLAQHPAEGEAFGRMMMGSHGEGPAAVAAAYDFSRFTHLVDVGGGVGTLLRTVLEANPHLRGTLFDQASVVAGAELGEVSDRVELLTGDFFESVPAGGDLYVLSHVLHDWPDEECLRILRSCRDALGPEGRLLLVEMVLPSDGTPHPSQFFDLIMLTVTGGQERDAEEYRSLLSRAGLEMTRLVPTTAAVSIIEAKAKEESE